MSRAFSVAIACACLAVVVTANTANAQTIAPPPRATPQSARPTTVRQVATLTPQLNAAEKTLVEASKAAILSAGLSAPYFEKHFRLLKVFNSSGDRRVVWQYTVGEYAATLNDSVGFYTDERGRRIDTHSVENILPAAREIERTISRARAERLMRACIGNFTGGSVVYAAQGSPPTGALVFTASRRPVPAREARREREERREQEERERRSRRAAGAGRKVERGDGIESETEEGGPPLLLGTVDLETGRCTRGFGISGHP